VAEHAGSEPKALSYLLLWSLRAWQTPAHPGVFRQTQQVGHQLYTQFVRCAASVSLTQKANLKPKLTCIKSFTDELKLC